MDEQTNTAPVENTEAGVEAPAPETAPSEAPVEAPEASVEPVDETTSPSGAEVLGTSSEGGVEVEPTPVIQ